MADLPPAVVGDGDSRPGSNAPEGSPPLPRAPGIPAPPPPTRQRRRRFHPLAWIGLFLFVGCLRELLRLAPSPGAAAADDPPLPPITPGRYRQGVMLDPGHGGADTGAVAGGLVEKDLTLDLARRVAGVLKRRGVPVHLTREEDLYVPLPTRVRRADARPGAIFVSIHFNHASTAAGGVETFFTARKDPLAPALAAASDPAGGGSRLWQWVSWLGGSGGQGRPSGNGAAGAVEPALGGEGQALASRIQTALVGGLSATDRGVKERGLYVTRHVRAPAVLVEGGFLSNPEEAKKLNATAYRQRLAEAIAAGILDYLNAPRPARPPAGGDKGAGNFPVTGGLTLKEPRGAGSDNPPGARRPPA